MFLEKPPIQRKRWGLFTIFAVNVGLMSAPIRLIIGLGNPGPQYETTRHNAGFWLLDHLADDYAVTFTQDKPFFSWVAKARVNNELVILSKPTTFMNRSGQAAGALMRFYKLTPEQVLVVHDELDLPQDRPSSSMGAVMPGIMVCETSSLLFPVLISGVCALVSDIPGISVLRNKLRLLS